MLLHTLLPLDIPNNVGPRGVRLQHHFALLLFRLYEPSQESADQIQPSKVRPLPPEGPTR